MNIQIFGTSKCFETKKAQRYFKERNIKFQFIDLKEKGFSKGELISVINANGGIDSLLNENCKNKETLILIKHLREEDKLEKILESQNVLVTPIVRNARKSTVGYAPEIWKNWD